MIIFVEKTLIIFAHAVIISIIFKNKDLKVFIIFKILNFHIKNLRNLERFGWPLYSGPFFNFCEGFVTSLKMYS